MRDSSRTSRIQTSDDASGPRDAAAVWLHPRSSTQTLELAVDDVVPVSMLIVLGFPVDLTDHIAGAVQRGLDAFPHFAGRIEGNLGQPNLRVVPETRGVLLEYQAADASLPELAVRSGDDLISQFFPAVAGQAESGLLRSPLLTIRATRLSCGGLLLGILVSHCLVDGTGLGRFLKHCVSQTPDAPRARPAMPAAIHSRDVLVVTHDSAEPLPAWYRVAGDDQDNEDQDNPAEWEIARKSELSEWMIDDEAIDARRSDKSAGRWFQLTALLCHQLGEVAGYTEAAMWCDLRRQLAIPSEYTGNVGCYWHVPIRSADSVDDLARRLREASSPTKNGRIAEAYRSIKSAQGQGRRVHWTGTEPHVLPVNLVPQSALSANLGGVRPQVFRMLTRNVHGLRIYRTQHPRGFLIECCLPGGIGAELRERCLAAGIRVRTIGQSREPF